MVLAAKIQQLAAVQVEGQASRPERKSVGSLEIEPGEVASFGSGLVGVPPSDKVGDFAALAATIPGVFIDAGQPSVMGLDPTNNATTLSGMAFSPSGIPRDVRATNRISTSTYDPARGWFSGLQTNVEIDQGNLYSNRRVHLGGGPRFLAYPNVARSTSGFSQQRFEAGIGGDGTLARDKFLYNYGAELHHESFVPFSALLDNGIAGAGLSSASRAKLLSELLPKGLSSSVTSGSSDQAQLIGRIDHSPINWSTYQPSNSTWALIGFADYLRDLSPGLGATSTHSNAPRTDVYTIGSQVLFSTYIEEKYLFDIRSALSLSSTDITSASDLPAAYVNVTDSDGTNTVSIAGSPVGGFLARKALWETTARSEFLLPKNLKHSIGTTLDFRFDRDERRSRDDLNGTYYFASIEDFANDNPSVYTRSLQSVKGNVDSWSSFLAVGDQWQASRRLSILSGLRAETAHPKLEFASNRSVTQLMGEHPGFSSQGIVVSPRIGFTWRLFGATSQVFSKLGAIRVPPTKYLRGGIGRFSGYLPTLIPGSVITESLGQDARQLRCVGAAAPNPPWVLLGNAATTPLGCVGSVGSAMEFADTTKTVHLLGRTFRAPSSWRGNLSFSSRAIGVTYLLDATYSRTTGLPSLVDRNFSPSPRFYTADENREVFVPASSVDSRTGTVATTAARISPALGQIFDHNSSGRAYARQISLVLTPATQYSTYFYSLAYTFSKGTAIANGFTEATFGSPTRIEASHSSNVPNHQAMFQGGIVAKGLTFTVFALAQSGSRFTPMISGDVNGDGLANDRAFVFDPANGRSTGNGEVLRGLLNSNSSRIRDCLTRQLGRAAERNSCVGPWLIRTSAQVSVNRDIPLIHRMANMSLGLENALSGVDYLLHGRSGYRGWGVGSAPDPVLLTLQAFDGAKERFEYLANPRFGRAIPNAIVPFQLTFNIDLDIGKSLPLQQLVRAMASGRSGNGGSRMTAAKMKQRYQRSVPNPYGDVLKESDSLLLSREQHDTLQLLEVNYLAGMDSIWTVLADSLSLVGDKFDERALLKTQETAVDSAWEYTRIHLRRHLASVLTKEQLALCSRLVQALVLANEPRAFRYYLR